MKANQPIFADLSTYSPKKSIAFYQAVFGWEFYKESDYYTAYWGNQPVAGLYEMPEKFKQMRMPHFWMTYIQVNDVDKTVALASKLGGIIEMSETIPDYGKLALLRDPLGAGFTIYEGEALHNTRTINTPSTLIWNELHVSDSKQVIPFYQHIFDWEIMNKGNGFAEIYNHNQEHIADVLDIPNQQKGKFEYWISSFGVQDPESIKSKIMAHGGTQIIDEGTRILYTDNSGEAFFYITAV